MRTTEHNRRHVLRIAFLLFGLYAMLAARLFHVQVTTASDFGERLHSMSRRVSYRIGRAQFERGRRGRILDSRDQVLALGYDTYRLMIDPSLPHRPRRASAALDLTSRVHLASDVLSDLAVEHDLDELLDKGTETHFRRVLDDGTDVLVERRSRLLLSGILPHERQYFLEIMRQNRVRNFYFEAESQREYPQGDVVAEIVGFLGHVEDDPEGTARGRAGIEMTFERKLGGRHGRYHCEQDGRGREIDLNGRWEEHPADGAEIGLTLDLRVQELVSDAITEVNASFDCDSVTGIVLETQTGRILAMRSVPAFTLEDLRAARVPMQDTRCRAVSDSYAPGSTFKPFVVARAIEQGIVAWDDEFDTNNGRRVFRHGRHGRLLKDSSEHGILSVTEIITKSSNIGMAMIGFEEMGIERLYDAVDS